MEEKVRVEFEFSAEQARELLASGSKAAETLTEEEFKALSRRGVIRASEYLTDQEVALVAGFLAKLGGKVVSKLTNKQVQKTAVATLTSELVDAGLGGQAAREDVSPKQ